jgi:hypothetical protein
VAWPLPAGPRHVASELQRSLEKCPGPFEQRPQLQIGVRLDASPPLVTGAGHAQEIVLQEVVDRCGNCGFLIGPLLLAKDFLQALLGRRLLVWSIMPRVGFRVGSPHGLHGQPAPYRSGGDQQGDSDSSVA